MSTFVSEKKNIYVLVFNDALYCFTGVQNVIIYSYVFVTDTNEAFVHFYSDYSVSSSGFHLKWNVVDMSGCPSEALTVPEGQIVSPNYPNFILPNLDCVTMIMAPGEEIALRLIYTHVLGITRRAGLRRECWKMLF